MQKKIAIFIPAYNVGQTLPLTLDRIPKEIKENVAEIFVIDNNSKDNSYLIAIGYKEKNKLPNLKVFKNKTNLGYGGSQKMAYKYAIKNKFDVVVMLHGDAQYAPEELPKLLKKMEKTDADLVFGSRMRGNPLKGGMPFWRYMGNRFLTFVENKVLDWNLSEFHSGYRIYKVDALKKIPFNKLPDDYWFDTDILIQFKVRNLKVDEAPIPTYYGEESGSPSVLDLAKYSSSILYAMFKFWLHKKGIKRIKKFEV